MAVSAQLHDSTDLDDLALSDTQLLSCRRPSFFFFFLLIFYFVLGFCCCALLTWTWAWRFAPSLRRLGAPRVAAASVLLLHFQCSCRRRRVVMHWASWLGAILVGELVFGVATMCRLAEPASNRRLGRTLPPWSHRCRPPRPGPPAQCRLAEPWRASVRVVVAAVVHCCLACGLGIGLLAHRAGSSSLSSWLALRRWRWRWLCRRLAGPLPCLPCVAASHVSSPWSVRRRASSCCHLATPVVAAGWSWFALLPSCRC